MHRMPLAVLTTALLIASGCSNAGPETVCICRGPVPEGVLDTACGTVQCVGGIPYRCTGPNTATQEGGTCGGPAPNPRPPDTPDLVFVSVSGHCLGPCAFAYNDEYLHSQGTIEVLAQPFVDAGFDVRALPVSDNFYDQDQAVGFLTLVQSLLDMREQWVANWDNPTRFIVVAHSHGAVWAHIALFVLEGWGMPLPVDVLIDLDGMSLGWQDKAFLGIGDAWGPVIRSHMAETGQTWPFDISRVQDAYDVPGLSLRQDIEDLIPDSVAVNLEVWADDTLSFMDTQANHRLDGSEREVLWFGSGLDHEDCDEPNADAVLWARDQLIALYGGG